ncbi:MAG: hypothetical protein ACXV5L_04710 [Thermoanaerobaculia bacterium]
MAAGCLACYSRAVHGAGEREAESWTGAAAVLVVACLAVFLARFQPALRLLVETARPAAAAAVVIAACIGYGFVAIVAARRLFLLITHERDDFEAVSLVDALLIGFAALGTVTAIVAWTGIAIQVLITIVAAIGAAIGIVVLWGVAVMGGGRGSPRTMARGAPAAALLLAAIPVLIAFVQAISPVNSPDELIYKLAVPHAWLLDGRMHELPLTAHSYVSMADQMASLPALILAGGIAARLLHFAIFIAALAALHRFGARYSETAAAAIVGIVAWTPALTIIAGWAWNEWSALGLLIVAFDRYERWVESTTPNDAAVAFAALGSAAAIKYTALPWILAMAVIAIARHRRSPRVLAAAAIIGVLFGGFFYVRNAIWTGSPLAPLLLPDAPAVANYRSGEAFEGWRDLMRGYDIFDPRIADESLGILLPAAGLVGITALWSRDRKLRDLAFLSAVQFPIVLTMSPGSRNAVNAFVPFAMAGAISVSTLMKDGGARRSRPTFTAVRVILGAVVVVALLAQLMLVFFVLGSYEVGPYLTGQEDAAGYLQRTRAFARPYGWLDRSTPPSARVLLLGENRPFYLQRSFISGGNLDGPRIAAWLSKSPSPDAFSAELQRLGVTHLLLHTPWYRVEGGRPGMLEKEYVLQVSAQTDAMLRAFLRTHARVVYRDGEYLIFELPGHVRSNAPM